jgi:hypothetical protein
VPRQRAASLCAITCIQAWQFATLDEQCRVQRVRRASCQLFVLLALYAVRS